MEEEVASRRRRGRICIRKETRRSWFYVKEAEGKKINSASYSRGLEGEMEISWILVLRWSISVEFILTVTKVLHLVAGREDTEDVQYFGARGVFEPIRLGGAAVIMPIGPPAWRRCSRGRGGDGRVEE